MTTHNEVRERAFDILEKDKHGGPLLRHAVNQAAREIKEEEERKKYDLDLIEKELEDYRRKNGTVSGDLIDKVLAAARHYESITKGEKP